MKKATLLAVACAIAVGAQSLAAQEPNEGVTYVSDPSQGVLVNRTRDNWFITAEGGANVYFSAKGQHMDLKDRIAPNAGLYVGKWFSPVFGARIGASWMQLKGVATSPYYVGVTEGTPSVDGAYYKVKTNEIGPMVDLMANLTNWFCGYKPNRVYNSIVYIGGGAYFTLNTDGDNLKTTVQAMRAGWINSFNVSKQVALSLDIRWTGLGGIQNEGAANWHKNYSDLSASIGVTYLFKNREWVAPVVPVCPEPQDCSEVQVQLTRANDKVDQLEYALRQSLNRPVETSTTVACDAPVATVYYPIGVSRLSRENQRVIQAVAAQMNSESYRDKNFVLTGWADNYTGTEAVNTRLRAQRAEGVRNLLVRNGVDASRLSIVENNGNRMGEGDQYVALDRAVTIEVR